MNGQFRSSFFRNFGFRGPGRYDIGDVLSPSQIKTYGGGTQLAVSTYIGSTQNPEIFYYGGLDSYYKFNLNTLAKVDYDSNYAEQTIWSITIPNHCTTYSFDLFGFYEDGTDLFIIYQEYNTGYLYIGKYRASDGATLITPILLSTNSTYGYSLQISANSRYILVTGWRYGGCLFDRSTPSAVWNISIVTAYEIGAGALDENYAYMSFDTQPFNRALSLVDGTYVKTVLSYSSIQSKYILKDNFLYGFDGQNIAKCDLAKSGTQVFNIHIAIEHIHSQDVSYDDNVFYVRSSGNNSVILALNFDDGSSAWAFSEIMPQNWLVEMAVSKNKSFLLSRAKDTGSSPPPNYTRLISKVEHFKIVS